MGTTGKGARYPELGDFFKPTTDIRELAEDLDAMVVASFTTAQRDALPVNRVWEGRLIWNSTLNRPQQYRGGAWRDEIAPWGTGRTHTPVFRAGRYYQSQALLARASVAGDSATGTVNRVFAAPFLVERDVTIDRIAANVATAGAAGSVARFGIYRDTGSFEPGAALLLPAGTVDCTTTGLKEVTILQALTPGVYWLAIKAEVAAPTFSGYAPSNRETPLNSIGAAAGDLSAQGQGGVCYVQDTGAAGALPDPMVPVAGAAAVYPRVYVRAA